MLNSASRNEHNSKGRSVDVPLSPAADKIEGTVALVKSGTEKVKTTPAGEYLTSALNDFDPEQYDSLATISDGVNKLLMLVCLVINLIIYSLKRVYVHLPQKAPSYTLCCNDFTSNSYNN